MQVSLLVAGSCASKLLASRFDQASRARIAICQRLPTRRSWPRYVSLEKLCSLPLSANAASPRCVLNLYGESAWAKASETPTQNPVASARCFCCFAFSELKPKLQFLGEMATRPSRALCATSFVNLLFVEYCKIGGFRGSEFCRSFPAKDIAIRRLRNGKDIHRLASSAG
uniref:Mos1 transposase HTH domain-containing protein n=1 Tax=Trichuris muris TaxID=70415 RepID=A0A5S6QYZ4_TRIMR